MKHLTCTFAATEAAFASYKIVTFTAPDMPGIRPGQLVLARVNDSLDPYLPSAYFPLPASQPAALSLLVAAGDPVSLKAAGDALGLIAPVGNGYTLDPSTRRLLLVGDEAHLAPLLALAHEASQKQIAVSLLVCSLALNAQQTETDNVSLSAWLSTLLPLDVEYQLTSDLSASLSVLLEWADQLCAAGDAALYTLLKEQLAREAHMAPAGGTPRGAGGVLPTPPFGPAGEAGLTADSKGLSVQGGAAALRAGGPLPAGFAQVIVAPLMACGFGACLGCAVETTRGVRLACVDGPVFDLAELA